jgi:hypothetical protein
MLRRRHATTWVLIGLGAALLLGAFGVARMAVIWHFVRSLAP